MKVAQLFEVDMDEHAFQLHMMCKSIKKAGFQAHVAPSMGIVKVEIWKNTGAGGPHLKKDRKNVIAHVVWNNSFEDDPVDHWTVILYTNQERTYGVNEIDFAEVVPELIEARDNCIKQYKPAKGRVTEADDVPLIWELAAQQLDKGKRVSVEMRSRDYPHGMLVGSLSSILLSTKIAQVHADRRFYNIKFRPTDDDDYSLIKDPQSDFYWIKNIRFYDPSMREE